MFFNTLKYEFTVKGENSYLRRDADFQKQYSIEIFPVL